MPMPSLTLAVELETNNKTSKPPKTPINHQQTTQITHIPAANPTINTQL